ncbi:hypothetical protein HO133_001093 [Letharia lupina]|uniref:Uncharacterized protein n=1 Tax=Letharia lupina TaxID=560253 RepID=A0A8H6FCH2_9LECA|nr:uncharacterized protein HO133_001093 [Letharia lupina]KAF6223041.1 hypothetical protein HO133_001093 [Letharia lupina]
MPKRLVMTSHLVNILLLRSSVLTALSSPVPRASSTCEKTQVAILGAGVAGITAAWIILTSSGDAYSIVEQDAGNILLENLQDTSFCAALNLAGWRPMGDAQAQAVEWYQLDFDFFKDNNCVVNQRGFKFFIHGHAREFLKTNDTRLHLNTIVKNITNSAEGVNILNADGIWQSLDHDSFLPGRGILYVTVVPNETYAIDAQDDDTATRQVLATLREMFGGDKVPEPAGMYVSPLEHIPTGLRLLLELAPPPPRDSHGKGIKTSARTTTAGCGTRGNPRARNEVGEFAGVSA